MIELFWELLVSVFGLALLATVAATPVALVALIVDGLIGSRMTARFRCWLWVIVAIRLMMPLAPGSAISLQNAWTLLDHTPANQAPVAYVKAKTASSNWEETPNNLAALPGSRPASVPSSPIDWEMIVAVVLITTWLAGASWVLLRAVVATLRFRRQLRSLPAVEDPAIVDTVRLACRDVGVETPVVKRVPGIASPALFGLRRPILCLPADETLTNSQLRMIALHEGTHIRRRDGWLAWLLTIVRAVHWCNPIAWLTAWRVEQYREQACDDAVRRHTNTDQHSDYAELLMRFATGTSPTLNLGLLGLWFARPAKLLTARIVAFTAGNRVRQLPWFLSAATVVVVAFLGLTDAVGGSDSPESSTRARPAFSRSEIDARMYVDERDGVEESPPANPLEEKTYDLTAALEKADHIPEGNDRLQWLLHYAKARFNAASPETQIRGDSADQITLTMPRRRHEFFANVLKEIERLGHTYQVVVETRVFPAESIESVPGIDWREAVRFASPPSYQTDWSEEASVDGGQRITSVEEGKPAASVETVSFEFAPFMVLCLNEGDMQRVDEFLKSRPQYARSQAPKITLFSGQAGTIRDQSQRPFVTAVDYVRGELATAAQPKIVVVEEGARIDFSPKIHDDDHLDMRCRLTLSAIDRVREVKLPGQEVTVQVPKVTRQTVSTTCRLKRGDSLLIAALGEQTLYCVITPRWFADPVN